MIQKIYTTIIAILIFSLGHTIAQNNTIGLMAKYDDEVIKLKVMPKDAYHWLLGIDNGFVISRRILGSETEFTPIHPDVIKPASEKQWPQNERGKEMYAFHIQAVEKVRNMRKEGSFLESFKLAIRANENYKLYAFITMRDKEFGDYTGLEFTDKNVNTGILYEYKVAIAETDIESLSILFDAQETVKSPTLNISNLEQAVSLNWVHDENTSNIGYYLERSETGFGYKRINEGPILPHKNNTSDTLERNRVFEVLRVDSLFQNYQPYSYRLVALDIWGDELPSSESVMGMGVDLTSPTLGNFELNEDTINRSFVINWDQSNDEDVASYFITRSYVLGGIDSVITQGLSPDVLTYIVDNPIEMQNHYFKIGAIDTSGNVATTESKAIFLADHTPPSKIDQISFVVDSLGRVNLEWSPSHDSNMKGYWVYRSFAKDRDFIKITDTVWTKEYLIDTCSIALLNNKRYYYIEALDESFNRSTASKVIEVKLPDTIPPSITTISNIETIDQACKISWQENQSEDVQSYLIYRKPKGGEWKFLHEVQTGNFFFMDHDFYQGKVSYQILAKDDSGNTCIKGQPYHFNKKVETNPELSLSLNKDTSSIQISWQKIGSKYKLYKSTGDKFHLLKYSNENSFQDDEVKNSNPVSYYVKAFDDRGILITSSEIKQL